MSPSPAKKSNKTSRGKRGGDGIDAANIAAAQQSVKRPGRRVPSNRKSAQSVATEQVDAVNSALDQLDDNARRNMFHGNIAISGGQFIQAENVIPNVNNNRISPFELLQHRVAPSAFHNSALRFDPPRCHPDTRVAILQKIYDWIVQSEDREGWLLWLNGAAGGGKSAIMQSIAERCAQAAIAVASFFFFRSDPTRNTMAPLIATLVYQLIQTIPETSKDILLAIERNPLIFDQSLESQLQLLLIQPLLRLPRRLQHLFVVLIDGLDECIDRAQQSTLIKLFSTISHGRNSPVLFLVASRREPQIEAAFAERQVSYLQTLPLDNSDIEQTSEDIRRFLTDKFKDIKQTHLRKHLLSSDWPQVSAVEEIVTKSSGQFIFGSVVINYVSSPRGNPAHLLEVIHGIRLRDTSSQNPFAHLDALYQYIFSQVEALDKVLAILAYILISKVSYIPSIEGAFQLEDGGLDVFFADLAAVFKLENGPNNCSEIKFLHASLPDFLRDKTRSERYYIDLEGYAPKLLCMFLDQVPPILDPLAQAHDLDIVSWQEYSRLPAILALLSNGAKASDQLQRSFRTFSIKFYKENFQKGYWVTVALDILEHLKKLDFNDQGEAYQHVLDVFVAEISKRWPLVNEHYRAIFIDFAKKCLS